MVYNPPNTHYSHINVNEIDPCILERVMGVKGVYFKAFTETMELKYVWWRKDIHVIELWGPFQNMSDAQKVMRNRINDISQLQ
jgi:hypothetical protein